MHEISALATCTYVARTRARIRHANRRFDVVLEISHPLQFWLSASGFLCPIPDASVRAYTPITSRMANVANVDMDAAAKLLSELNEQMQAFKSGDAKARQKAVSAARTLANTLETPSEWMVRSTWAEVFRSLLYDFPVSDDG